MKKSLFALAAMGAFTGAAQAQSSVTVYGILDVGYIGSNTRLATGTRVTQTQTSQFGQSAEQTSRMGFRGTEDLGGGTRAFFTAEFELEPQSQDLSGNTRGGLLNRQTFVGLGKKGLGQMALGTQYTPVFNAGAATSPGQYNNMLGDVVYAGSITAQNSGGGATSAGYTNRTSNTLTLQSDSFGGFRLAAMYTLNNSNTTIISTSSGGNTNANGWGLGADFSWQKLYIAAAYQALTQRTEPGFNDGTTPTSTNSVAWTTAQPSACTGTSLPATTCMVSNSTTTSGLNIKDNQALVGATYDFGILKAYAQWTSRKASSALSSNYYLQRSAQQIGVRGYMTKTIEGWASVGNGSWRAFGNSQPTSNFVGYQLGSNYWLSKRTNLYAIYGAQNFSNATVSSTSGSTSANLVNYALGVRHTF